MPLSASEIDALEFSVSLRGYNIRQVDDALDRLASQTHRRDRELGELRTRLHEATTQLEAAQHTIDDLGRQLARSHELAQAATDQAQRQADEVQQLIDDQTQLRTALETELEQQVTAIRAEADARIAEADRRVAEVDQEIDRRVAAINGEVEKRIQRLYDDAEHRVGEAWAQAEVERTALQHERRRVDAELQALREIVSSLSGADATSIAARLQALERSSTTASTALASDRPLSNDPAPTDDVAVEPDVGEPLDEPVLPRASLQLVPGEREDEPEPEVHEIGGFRIKVFPESESS